MHLQVIKAMRTRIVLFLLIITTPFASGGDECASPYLYMGEFASRYIGIEKSGSLLFLLNESDHQIEVFEASHPTNPLPILNYTDFDGLRAMTDAELRWPLMYLTDSYRGMIVLDLGNLFNIQERGVVNLGWAATAIDVEGDYAYIAHANDGLVQVSIEDPDDPIVVASVGPGNQAALSVCATNDLVAVGYVNGLVQLYDISVPDTMSLLGELQVDQRVTALGIDQSDLYVGTSRDLNQPIDRTLYCFDIAEPTSPVQLDSRLLQSDLIDIDIQPDSVCVTSDAEGLLVFSRSLQPTTQLSTPYTLAKTIIDDNIAYTALEYHQMMITDLAGARTPARDSVIPISVDESSHIEVSGDYMYVLGGGFDDAIAVIDISDEDHWQELHQISTLSDENDQLCVSGDLLLHAVSRDPRIDIYSIAEPKMPVLLSSMPLPHDPTRMVVRDSAVFIGTKQGHGVRVIDISDPGNPVEASVVWDGFTVDHLTVIGSRLYTVRQGNRVDQLEVSDLENVELLTTQFFSFAGMIEYSDEVLLFSSSPDVQSPGGLYICELDQAGRIVPLTSMQNAQGTLVNPYLYGDYLFAPAEDHGMYIWEIGSNPVPQLASHLTFFSDVHDLIIIGNQMTFPVGDRLYRYDLSSLCGFSCQPDLNRDGSLDFFDVSIFLVAFNNQQPLADFDSNEQFDFFDVSLFLHAFLAGCS